MAGIAGRSVRLTELALSKNRIAVLPDLCFLANDLDKYMTLNTRRFEGRINKKILTENRLERPSIDLRWP